MKKFTILVVYALLLMACSEKKDQFPAPANPDASPEAKALLNFLYSIKGKYILSGEHNFVSTGSKYHEVVHDLTGKYPVVWGSDFSFNALGETAKKYQHCGPINMIDFMDPDKENVFHGISPDTLRARLVEEIIEKYKQGHIITLMWHNCFPAYGDSCDGSKVWAMEKRPTAQEWDSLVTPGTKLNNQWKSQVNIILPYLKQLKEANIPVLWRPYHEMNGVWFWWCNQKGDKGFKRLWIMMYDYFVKEHQLNNLLWVWNTNAPRNIPGDEAFPYEDFFPGAEYVDILAADVYNNDWKQSHHDDLLKLGKGKLIALGELGQLPTVEQIKNQKDWSWFMVWGYFINHFNDPKVVKEIYAMPHLLTLDEVRKDDNGWQVLIK